MCRDLDCYEQKFKAMHAEQTVRMFTRCICFPLKPHHLREIQMTEKVRAVLCLISLHYCFVCCTFITLCLVYDGYLFLGTIAYYIVLVAK